MRRWIFAYLGAAVVFAGLDATWLTLTSATLYRPVLGQIMLTSVRMVPAVAFYLVYLLGAVIFAVAPALEKGSWRAATLRGALFGFFAYATYDLTNQATLAVWATKITVLDLMWGTVVTACGATAGYFAGKLGKPN